MAKVKSIWSCASCGHNQHNWAGQCPLCKEWSTFNEEATEAPRRFAAEKVAERSPSKPIPVNEVPPDKTKRIHSHSEEFNRLMGGGIVPGAYTLIGGEPGIGKSTLMLQLAQGLAKQGLVVLYVCGEESVEQTSLRARRLNIDSSNLLLLSETCFESISGHITRLQPDVLVVDSIQIVYKSDLPSAPGSVSQVREVATELMHLAKSRHLTTFLVGHVTKAGELAGPRVLEHLVDTVLYFEGDRQHNYRLIRSVKNRFGSADEVAVFQMGSKGLDEVANPSELFLDQRTHNSIGSVVVPTVEGSRPILVEVQALVTDTVFSSPSRRCAGLDQNRLALLLAVLEKRLGYPMHGSDVFVAMAGGLRVVEPALDLGVLLAVASSFRNRVFCPNTIVAGEVGLGGEVRGISRIENRIKEASRMGFTRCLVPKSSVKGLPTELTKDIHIKGIQDVEEAIDVLLS